MCSMVPYPSMELVPIVYIRFPDALLLVIVNSHQVRDTPLPPLLPPLALLPPLRPLLPLLPPLRPIRPPLLSLPPPLLLLLFLIFSFYFSSSLATLIFLLFLFLLFLLFLVSFPFSFPPMSSYVLLLRTGVVILKVSQLFDSSLFLILLL